MLDLDKGFSALHIRSKYSRSGHQLYFTNSPVFFDCFYVRFIVITVPPFWAQVPAISSDRVPLASLEHERDCKWGDVQLFAYGTEDSVDVELLGEFYSPRPLLYIW